MHQTQFSEKNPYRGFSQIWSHIQNSNTATICDRIWENPAYLWPDLGKPSVRDPRTIRAICIFSSSGWNLSKSIFCHIHVEQPFSHCYRGLRRLVDLYKGEIGLHFDPPSRPSYRTRSPLLWALSIIPYLHTARFIKLLYVRSPF